MVREKRVVYKSHGVPNVFFRSEGKEKRIPVDPLLYELKEKELKEAEKELEQVDKRGRRLFKGSMNGSISNKDWFVESRKLEDKAETLQNKIGELRVWLIRYCPKRTIIQKRSEKI